MDGTARCASDGTCWRRSAASTIHTALITKTARDMGGSRLDFDEVARLRAMDSRHGVRPPRWHSDLPEGPA